MDGSGQAQLSATVHLETESLFVLYVYIQTTVMRIHSHNLRGGSLISGCLFIPHSSPWSLLFHTFYLQPPLIANSSVGQADRSFTHFSAFLINIDFISF